MPLTMVKTGETNIIKKVGGREETRRFLENLGFVTGGSVTVISEIGGNVIVNIKESRVAINKEMATKILAVFILETQPNLDSNYRWINFTFFALFY